MSRHLFRLATLVAIAGWAIALSAPTALGQLPSEYDFSYRWTGWVTCTTTGHSPSQSDYTNQETHHWEIMPVAFGFQDNTGLRTWYWASWAVTGSGSNADFSWTTNGTAAWDILQFWVPSFDVPGTGSTLNIALYEGSALDPFGVTVKNEVNGTLSKTTVRELPFPTIVAIPTKFERASVFGDRSKGSINIVQGGSSRTINGSIFSNNEFSDKRIKEPDDGINIQTCSWDFVNKPLQLKPLPGKLCPPGTPDCDKPFVLKPPIKKPD